MLLKFGKQLYTVSKALESQTKAKKPLKKIQNSDLKSINNTKTNGLKNAHFPKISVPGLICAIKVRQTALYSLEGPVESN